MQAISTRPFPAHYMHRMRSGDETSEGPHPMDKLVVCTVNRHETMRRSYFMTTISR